MRRILICQGRNKATLPLQKMVKTYFTAADNLFVNLTLQPELALAGAIPSGTGSRRIAKRSSFLRHHKVSFEDVVRETQFSDLVAISDTQYHQFCDWSRTCFVPNTAKVFCPILVVPAQAERLEQMILIDDGAPATYQRIKQIACLFSELCLATPTTLLMLNNPDKSATAQDEKLWISYLKLHFAQLAIYRAEESSLRTLPTAIDCSKNALVVRPTRALPSYLAEVLAPLPQFELIL